MGITEFRCFDVVRNYLLNGPPCCRWCWIDGAYRRFLLVGCILILHLVAAWIHTYGGGSLLSVPSFRAHCNFGIFNPDYINFTLDISYHTILNFRINEKINKKQVNFFLIT